MDIITQNFRILKRYIILSYKNQREFKFDFYMKIIAVFMELLFVALFWKSLSFVGISFINWNYEQIFLLAIFNFISAFVSKLFFGFRDLEYKLISGDFDSLISKPANPVMLSVFEKINITNIIGKFLLSMMLLTYAYFDLNLSLWRIFFAVMITFMATTVIEILYGIVSHAAFFLGKIYDIRELLFTFREATKYPLDIYPKSLFNFFVHFLPIAMISTIPVKIVQNNLSPYPYLIIVSIVLILVSILLYFVNKISLRHYQSTGS